MVDELRTLLTLEGLMERLQLSRATIFRLKTQGLPFVKVGRSLRFDPLAVSRWLQEQETKTTVATSGHLPALIRERLIQAFDEADRETEWWENLASPQEAAQLLGKLWNCTDVVPSSTRESAADWVTYVLPGDRDLAHKVRSGCTYAVLSRTLKPLLELVLERKDDV